MSTLQQTVWVNSFDEFRATIDRYISEGGVVQEQEPGATTLFVEKKLNVVVLVVGLVLCLLPGLAYLGWYLWADKDQVVTVRMGKPDNIGGYQPGGEPEPAELPPHAASAENLAIPPASATPPAAPVPPATSAPVTAPVDPPPTAPPAAAPPAAAPDDDAPTAF
ncbi:MAG: hypothetical protein KDB35_13495 [Acidimicrobiales bacterium]|nr:hypothetical protein [Acidimicrobiales bacterium]MCB1259761.1 hypothetical protein [Acidimicrobiales bacterium]